MTLCWKVGWVQIRVPKMMPYARCPVHMQVHQKVTWKQSGRQVPLL